MPDSLEQPTVIDQRPHPLIVYYHNRQLPISAQIRGRTALDVGCGEATNTLYLAAYGYDTIGVDNDPQYLAQAQTNLQDRNARRVGNLSCSFVEADIRTMPAFDEPFDLVTATEVLHHLPKSDQYDVLRDMQRRTTQRGIHIVSGYLVSQAVSDPINRAQMLQPGALRRFYEQAGWSVRVYRHKQGHVQRHASKELVGSRAELIAVPPVNHQPSA